MDTKKLRQKILDLAIRGKLVPQDPNDEPASVLLEKIREEKKQMVKDGKLKPKDIKNDTIIFKGEDNLHYRKLLESSEDAKKKVIENFNETTFEADHYYELFRDGTVKDITDEIPFDVPEGWEWTRIFSIVNELPYGTSKKSALKGKIIVLRMGNIQNGEVDYSDLVYSSDDNDIKKYSLSNGDLLFNRTNSSEWVGKTSIYRGDYPAIYAGYIIRLRTPLNPEYLNSVMNSSYAYQYCRMVKTDGVNQSNINAQKLGAFLVPVAPILEQVAIARKIEEIIPKINSIAENNTDLRDAVAFVKRKVLDLAIRGKLVPQDPNDEPASVLLDRIRTEKEDLIKQGKLKRDKKESIIYKGDDNCYYEQISKEIRNIDEEIPFEIPSSWTWCKLNNIAEFELGKTLDKAKNSGEYHKYLRSINVKWGATDLSDLNEMKFEDDELERYSIKRNDLLICEGGDVGRSCVWEKDHEMYYQNALHRVRFYQQITPYFYMYVMKYFADIGKLDEICKGVTIKHLTRSTLLTLLFPLPPLEEQKKICNKIKEFNSYIDTIEISLK